MLYVDEKRKGKKKKKKRANEDKNPRFAGKFWKYIAREVQPRARTEIVCASVNKLIFLSEGKHERKTQRVQN